MGSIADRVSAAVPLTRLPRRRGARASRWERWSDGVEIFVAREGDARFHLHWHEEWSLGAILSGSCNLSCAGRRHLVRAGDVVVIPPLAVHAAGTGPGRFAMVMLYLPVELVERELGLRPDGAGAKVWTRPAAARALERAVEARRLPAVWRVFAQAVVRRRAGRLPDAAPPDPRVVRVAELLGAAPDHLPDVATLARGAGLSREHLHRLFRRSLGLTPGQYLRQSRIALAKRLLRRGEPIVAAAAACGFTDQAHFTRWFRRTFGVTPGMFAGA